MANKKWDNLFEGTALQEPRCYESHPTLKIGKGTLCGGSASWPVVTDADVYVALQSGSSCKLVDPWDGDRKEVHFGISDQKTPDDIPRFKKMIDWLCNQLQKGKKVHVGCIGGHGRTGMVLAAIVAQALKEKDAIQFVRKHYCHKAVESFDQVAFLVKHYGVSKVPSRYADDVRMAPASTRKHAKTGMGGGVLSSRTLLTSYPDAGRGETGGNWPSADRPAKKIGLPGVTKDTKIFEPLASNRSIWKRKR